MGNKLPKMGKKKVSISNALFSKVQQKVLGILYGQNNATFSLNEIIKLAQSGSGAVQREVEKLTLAELVTVRIINNKKIYQANQNSPLFAELRSIVLKTFGLADAIREAITPISSEISIAFIYGSVAKNEDTAKSDIDLMIIGERLSYSDIFQNITTAEEQLGRKINPTFYSLSDWKLKSCKDNNFINQVKKQAKIFVIGTEEELNELSQSC